MKKSLLVISAMFISAIILMGCATKADLERTRAQEQQINMKADEAIKASQEAKETAAKATEAAAKAEERAKAAEERADAAEKANAAFKGSMKK